LRPHRLTIILGLLGAVAGTNAADAAPGVAQVSATLVKPLTLVWIQDLDLGSVLLGPGSWSGATVTISQTGVLSCTNANVTCTGAAQPAKYTATGTNNQIVRVTAPNVTLTNQSDSTKTLTLVVDSPTTVAIPNSGQKGVDFAIGGAITVNSTTSAGTYSGTFNVTVDYN